MYKYSLTAIPVRPFFNFTNLKKLEVIKERIPYNNGDKISYKSNLNFKKNGLEVKFWVAELFFYKILLRRCVAQVL